VTLLSTARAAYAAPSAPIRTTRGTEYEVVARITQRLKSATARADTDFPGLAAALAENHALWLTLATDVAEEGNQLPRQLWV
jgi:flagellar protein FlaF